MQTPTPESQQAAAVECVDTVCRLLRMAPRRMWDSPDIDRQDANKWQQFYKDADRSVREILARSSRTATPVSESHAALVKELLEDAGWAEKIVSELPDEDIALASGLELVRRHSLAAAVALRAHPAGGVIERKPFKMLIDQDSARRFAELEDGCEVGAGILRPEASASVTAEDRVQTVALALFRQDFGQIEGWDDAEYQKAYDTCAYAPYSGNGFVNKWTGLARAALRAAGIGAGVVSEGWKLVRLMPDEETIAVAWQAVDSDRVSEVDVEKILRAGIAAAPSHDKE